MRKLNQSKTFRRWVGIVVIMTMAAFVPIRAAHAEKDVQNAAGDVEAVGGAGAVIVGAIACPACAAIAVGLALGVIAIAWLTQDSSGGELILPPMRNEMATARG